MKTRQEIIDELDLENKNEHSDDWYINYCELIQQRAFEQGSKQGYEKGMFDGRAIGYEAAKKDSEDEVYKHWDFHQGFLVKLCSVLHEDFCVESEESLLTKIKKLMDRK